MTPKYWFKIFFAMFAIFAVGMVAVQGIKAGRDKVEELTQGSTPFTIPLFGLPFKLDGVELGALNKLRIERDGPQRLSGFHLNITLNDASPLEMLATCNIAIEDPDDIDENTAFICASDDSGAVEMVSFGTIIFQPSGQRHILNVPATWRDKVRAEADQAEGHDGDTISSVRVGEHGGTFRLDLNGKELIRIIGDSAGGSVTVRDPATGKPVVEINGGP